MHRSPFIVGAAYDVVFFLAAPLVAVGLGALAAHSGAAVVVEYGDEITVQALALRTLIYAHLVIVFARSHANQSIFPRYPARFVVVPIVALAAMLSSSTLLALTLTVVVCWDMVHSSLQTFGLARLYERRVNADPQRGRGFDLWLCHALYLGTFLAGPLSPFVVRTAVSPLAGAVPAALDVVALAERAAPMVRIVAVAASLVAVVAWAANATSAARAGARVSWPKLALYASTAAACVVAWGVDSFGAALLIVNVFHAVQYFGLVAHSERASLAARLRLPARHAAPLVLFALALVGGLYGFWLGASWQLWLPAGAARTVGLAVVNLVALLHFWYDGFLWRVRDDAVR